MSEPGSGAPDVSRLVVASIMVLVLLAVMSWLQGRFDSSDHRKAITMVTAYRAKNGGGRLVDGMLARHPGVEEKEISWTSEITRGCLGHVRVYGYVPKKDGVDSKTYAFDVNLTGPSLHPTDETTIAILTSLTATSAAARD